MVPPRGYVEDEEEDLRAELAELAERAEVDLGCR